MILKLDPREITPQLEPTKKCVAIDVGLKYFYCDSNNETVKCPNYYRKSEKHLNKLNRRKSRKFVKGKKQSNNYIKAKKRYAKKHLKVSRQREEFAKEKALRLIQSNDLVAYEDLKVKNLVRNNPPAFGIPPDRGDVRGVNDAAWSLLRKWIEYFGLKYGRLTIAVPPHYTSSDCPSCGKRVKKSLSTRTHICDCGIPVLDRDYAASLNILKKATIGHIGSWSDEIADGRGLGTAAFEWEASHSKRALAFPHERPVQELDLNAWGDSTEPVS